jgi:plasmid stabilization system protein ParE
MRTVIAPRAQRELAQQLGYLVDRGAIAPARRLEERLTNFLENTLSHYPRTGTYLAHREL